MLGTLVETPIGSTSPRLGCGADISLEHGQIQPHNTDKREASSQHAASPVGLLRGRASHHRRVSTALPITRASSAPLQRVAIMSLPGVACIGQPVPLGGALDGLRERSVASASASVQHGTRVKRTEQSYIRHCDE